jgi:spore cortex formation protein SpoVR/YcgB (stage V sporulation)
MSSRLITDSSEWSFPLLERFDREIGNIAHNVYGLDTYANQIEVISSEQMIDAYSSVGLPINYQHWSFGKQFVVTEQTYRRGQMGLAYEIVINSDPCIAYLMEENTLPMQALVIAHACYGHNSFFKGNYLFRTWTSADAIIDYLVFARRYIAECEERYGQAEVEGLLDSCHALMNHGVDRYKRPTPLTLAEEQKRQKDREAYLQSLVNDLWRTLPVAPAVDDVHGDLRWPEEPQENLLYFIEKNAPLLEPWQREVVRIVRKLGQYFYPQRQTQVMNEGWATYWHYTLMNHLYDEGFVNDGFMMEFLQSHTGVVFQPTFDKPYYNGINPYALGFAMMRDIRRICEDPTDEDRAWFPDIAGGDWQKVLDFAMRNFKDESFIAQFLSPHLMREFRLFAICDDDREEHLEVKAIHEEQGYRAVRQALAEQYNLGTREPNIQVVSVDRRGDRSMTLRHYQHNRRPLGDSVDEILRHIRRLWGFPVRLESLDDNGRVQLIGEC